MSIADTGKLPASAISDGPNMDFEPTNSWLAAEARRRERAKSQSEPQRSQMVNRQGRRLASGTAYLSVPVKGQAVPVKGKGPSIESRADTVDELNAKGEADTEDNLVALPK